MTQFSSTSTTDEVLAGIDLSGKRTLVTGVSAGMGVDLARVLAVHGAEVTGTARDMKKSATATAGWRDDIPNGGRFAIMEMDLASLASVRHCADTLVAAGKPIDLVIANAGVMAPPFGLTADGFETQFGTNHLGHFVFVNRIAPLLAPGARVVVLSSMAHRIANVDLEDPNFEYKPYFPWRAYGQSKTANAPFAVEFDRRHRARKIRATIAHPGSVETELSRHMGDLTEARKGFDVRNAQRIAEGKEFMPLKTPAQGAATAVWAGVVAPVDEVAGRYCADCHVVDAATGDRRADGGLSVYALNPGTAKALWARSEELVGETF